MLAVSTRAARAVALRSVRAASTAAAAPVAASADPEHAAWLKTVSKYPVSIPTFEWTLEWVLPTPVPLHQFEQTPLVVEVKDRHPDADALIYRGPNVIAGYPHPETGKLVTREEHAKAMGVRKPQDHSH